MDRPPRPPPAVGPPVGVCVVGSLSADLVVRVPRRPESGETVIGTGCDTFLGGKGLNQAVAAARSGAATAMVGALGDDAYGEEIVTLLDREHVDTSGVSVIAGSGTGLAFPVVDESGENSIIVVPRANHLLSVDDIARLDGLLGRATVALMQLELPTDVVIAAAMAARRSGAIVVLNPAPAVADPARFAGLVDIVVPNETELALLVPDLDLTDAAATLSRVTGAGRVVVTLAERGAYAWTADGDFAVPGLRVDAIDTVGAGDAFCGALAAQLATGAAFEGAVRYANAAGALATTRPGAEPSMPRRDAVAALLAARG